LTEKKDKKCAKARENYQHRKANELILIGVYCHVLKGVYFHITLYFLIWRFESIVTWFFGGLYSVKV
jgi:hypothetical protein